jgi:hypothetical protein
MLALGPDDHPALREVVVLEPRLLELLKVVRILHARAPAQVLKAVQPQVVMGKEAMLAVPQRPTCRSAYHIRRYKKF